MAESEETKECASDAGGDGGSEEEKQLRLALRAAGAQLLGNPKANERGVRIFGWRIMSQKRSILNMNAIQRWEKMLDTIHLPDMVFGDSFLELVHEPSGIRIHFNAFDALQCWKKEALPPVEVHAAAIWKSREPLEQAKLDYDYTFTTNYCGSETIQLDDTMRSEIASQVGEKPRNLEWVECEDRIDLTSLQARDPILFYDEVVLYEDELADNGISFLTVKVRVMPSCWFLLLRYWLRVDQVLVRLRDTRIYSPFQKDGLYMPLVVRERCIREDTFQALLAKGVPFESLMYNDPSNIYEKFQIHHQHHEKLVYGCTC